VSRPDKKDRTSSASNGSPESADESRARPGLPDEASVLSEKAFTSPKGKEYRIIKTDETDPYDAPLPPKEQRGDGADP
jgi:hypothetical protein